MSRKNETAKKKLNVTRTALRTLDRAQLDQVAGGAMPPPTYICRNIIVQ